MNNKKTIELFQYWNRLRGKRMAPKRTEIEPSDIKTLLADTFILEKDTRGNPVFRLAGTRICAIFGRELKGFSFPSLWPEKESQLMARLLADTFDNGQVISLCFDGISRNNRVAQFEMIAMTLDGGNENPRALGLITAVTAPYWLGADPVVQARITSVRVVDPEREPVYLKNRPAVPVPALQPEEITVLAEENLESGRRIHHLVVLPGGKEQDGNN